MSSFLHARKRRGSAVILVAVAFIALMGFAALAIDMSYAIAHKDALQQALDSTALSSVSYAAKLPGSLLPKDICEEVVEYGEEFVTIHPVMNTRVQNALIEPGLSMFDDAGKFVDFQAKECIEGVSFNSFRVTGDLGSGVTAILGSIFDYDAYDIEGSSIAMLSPKDHLILYDRSGSMNWDSTLRHVNYMIQLRGEGYTNARITLGEAWGALGQTMPMVEGPEEGVFRDDYSSSVAGPKYGIFMNKASIPRGGYGQSDGEVCDESASYRPHDDPGLVYLPNETWDSATLEKLDLIDGTGVPTDKLVSSGGTPLTLAQIQEVANVGDGTETRWQFRTAIALGLYYWDPSDGSDITIDPGELVAYVPEPELEFGIDFLNWIDYMDNDDVNYGNGPHDDFRYTFGVKTLMNYILIRMSSPSEMRQLYAVGSQPDWEVKHSIIGFMKRLGDMRNDDQVGMIMFSEQNGSQWSAKLVADMQEIDDAYYSGGEGAPETPFPVIEDEMYALQPDGATATGWAIRLGLDYFEDHETYQLGNGVAPRDTAGKSMILFTDGVANVGEDGKLSDPLNPDGAGAQYAYDMAVEAASKGVVIHTLSIGSNADWEESCTPETLNPGLANCGVGQFVAYITGGLAFYAYGDIETIGTELTDALKVIGSHGNSQIIN